MYLLIINTKKIRFIKKKLKYIKSNYITSIIYNIINVLEHYCI